MKNSKSRPNHPAPAKAPQAPWRWRGILLACLGGALGVVFLLWPTSSPPPAATAIPAAQPATFFRLEPERAAFARYGGSESCKDCHKEAYALWRASNHALAERAVSDREDRRAFVPPRTFAHGTQSTSVRADHSQFEVASLGEGERRDFLPVERVIGRDPLRQFLVPFSGGRWQVLEASYDPRSNEWFNVFGQEDRCPGEWGHWTGRGMNWNTMCAACHNTRLRKNYDSASDSYHTAMVEMGVGCEACHGPMKDHVDWQNQHPVKNQADPTVRRLSRTQTLHNCAFCHARRTDLTGDFQPGDQFFDHQSLAIVDETDTFYPDGQVRDEDYEFSAYLGSRMHAGGIVCGDCHNPHSMKTVLPGNLLCLRCHSGSHTNAPIIDPVAHSFHKVFDPAKGPDGQPREIDLTSPAFQLVKETGGECVNCHMPQTPYMQRHWRHDHGWTVPDPLLTKQFGIPNACNRCHATNDVDWALGYVEKWYGKKMDRPSRKRAQTVAQARAGNDAAREPLLGMLKGDPYGYWRAVAAGLLDPWAHQPAVAAALAQQAADTNALVRVNVMKSLGRLAEAGHPEALGILRAALADPVRAVRFQAAMALRAELDERSPAGQEFLHALAVNSDQPVGRMQQGLYQLARRNPAAGLAFFQQAAAWDPHSAAIRHELAVVLSMNGQQAAALREMREAVRLAPKEAEYRYKLGLALYEAGDPAGAVKALEETVAMDGRHARAWYNLGLARHAQGQSPAAVEALARAEALTPSDARIPYAQATIWANLGRRDEARAAARRALACDPEYSDARQLLESLSR